MDMNSSLYSCLGREGRGKLRGGGQDFTGLLRRLAECSDLITSTSVPIFFEKENSNMWSVSPNRVLINIILAEIRSRSAPRPKRQGVITRVRTHKVKFVQWAFSGRWRGAFAGLEEHFSVGKHGQRGNVTICYYHTRAFYIILYYRTHICNKLLVLSKPFILNAAYLTDKVQAPLPSCFKWVLRGRRKCRHGLKLSVT